MNRNEEKSSGGEDGGPWVCLAGCDDGRRYLLGVPLIKKRVYPGLDGPHGQVDPLCSLEEQEQLTQKRVLLDWLLEEAARQGIVANPDSKKFVLWARAMIEARCHFDEREVRGLSS